MPCRQRRHFGHVGAVAVHAEDRFGDDKTEFARMLDEQFVEVGEVIVAEADLLHASEAGMQTGMIEPVGEDQGIVAEFQQCGEYRTVELIAGGEDQCRLGAFEACELFFQRQQLGTGAGDEPRGAAAGAMTRSPLTGALDQQRMAREAEIVVRGDVDQRRSMDAQMSALAGRL